MKILRSIIPPDTAAPAAVQGRMHDRIVDDLGRRILSGELPSGAVVGDMPPASRTAKREGMRVLAAKGLIESRTRLGTTVRPRENWNMLDPQVLTWALHDPVQSPRIMNELYALRMAIEPVAAGQAALNATPDDHTAILRALRGMAHYLGNADRAEQDLSFHLAILRATKNIMFLSLSHLISVGLRHVFAAGFAATPQDDDHWLGQHRAIADAIVAGDAPGAAAAMRVLLDDAQKRHDI